MIEFRWIVFLTLWTVLVGPIMDFSPTTSTAQPPHSKPAAESKAPSAE